MMRQLILLAVVACVSANTLPSETRRDVPLCEGFFCRRGTNCYIRSGSPTCLPNTFVLSRRGKPSTSCTGKYCPSNSRCDESGPTGAHCVKI